MKLVQPITFLDQILFPISPKQTLKRKKAETTTYPSNGELSDMSVVFLEWAWNSTSKFTVTHLP